MKKLQKHGDLNFRAFIAIIDIFIKIQPIKCKLNAPDCYDIIFSCLSLDYAHSVAKFVPIQKHGEATIQEKHLLIQEERQNIKQQDINMHLEKCNKYDFFFKEKMI